MMSALAVLALIGSAFAGPTTTRTHKSTHHVRAHAQSRPAVSVRAQVRTRPVTVRAQVRTRPVTVRAHVSTRPVSDYRSHTTTRPVSDYRSHTTTRHTTSTYRPSSHHTHNSRPSHVRPLAVPRHRPNTYTRPRHVYVRPYVSQNTYHYRPTHGIFVYGPRPQYHDTYRSQTTSQEVRQEHLPSRSVNRQGTWAFGVRSGSYLAAYDGSNPYGDFGLGLTARYRPFEALGLEAALTHHDQTWENDTERSQTIGQASVMVFANPWGRLSPYALGGLTANSRTINDAFRVSDGGMNSLQTDDLLWGPHAGVGLELAFGDNVALDLEARYVGYLNTERDDPTIPGALQTSAGFIVHF